RHTVDVEESARYLAVIVAETSARGLGTHAEEKRVVGGRRVYHVVPQVARVAGDVGIGRELEEDDDRFVVASGGRPEALGPVHAGRFPGQALERFGRGPGSAKACFLENRSYGICTGRPA